jgi:hypothetical protein
MPQMPAFDWRTSLQRLWLSPITIRAEFILGARQA